MLIIYPQTVIRALKNKEHALLQSPTGTGKTLCLLCACLAWLKVERESNKGGDIDTENRAIKIVYTSRTHSQLKQAHHNYCATTITNLWVFFVLFFSNQKKKVMNELKDTCYRPSVSLMGSREQLCVKPDFQGLDVSFIQEELVLKSQLIFLFYSQNRGSNWTLHATEQEIMV